MYFLALWNINNYFNWNHFAFALLMIDFFILLFITEKVESSCNEDSDNSSAQDEDIGKEHGDLSFIQLLL